MRDPMTTRKKRVQQVESNRAMPYIEIHLVHRIVFLQRAAGAIHEDVEPSEPGGGRIDSPLDAIVLSDIGLYEQRFAARIAHFLFGRAACSGVDLRNADARTFARISECR